MKNFENILKQNNQQHLLKYIEMADNNQKEILESYIGKEVEVLFEEEKGGYWQGHTTNYMTVKTKTGENLKNLLLKIKIGYNSVGI